MAVQAPGACGPAPPSQITIFRKPPGENLTKACGCRLKRLLRRWGKRSRIPPLPLPASRLRQTHPARSSQTIQHPPNSAHWGLCRGFVGQVLSGLGARARLLGGCDLEGNEAGIPPLPSPCKGSPSPPSATIQHAPQLRRTPTPNPKP